MTNIDLDKLEQLKEAVCDADSATEWINALNNATPALIAELREARATIERQAAEYDGALRELDSIRDDLREALDGER
ncbi:hypothetical protein [Rhodococcus sp. BE178]|uniref:hypothetical protein n=1 Tax=Rhodococcus sp. BE178 TaxID=2817737 RepID=UPI003D1EB9EE